MTRSETNKIIDSKIDGLRGYRFDKEQLNKLKTLIAVAEALNGAKN